MQEFSKNHKYIIQFISKYLVNEKKMNSLGEINKDQLTDEAYKILEKCIIIYFLKKNSIEINEKVINLFNLDYCEDKSIIQEVIKSFSDYDWDLDEFSGKNRKNKVNPSILGDLYENRMSSLKREKTGSYYTPRKITKYICEHTIFPYIQKRINEKFALNLKIDVIHDLFNYEKKKDKNDVYKQFLKITDKNPQLVELEEEDIQDINQIKPNSSSNDLSQISKNDIIQFIYFNVLETISIADISCGCGAFIVYCTDFIINLHLQCIEWFIKTRKSQSAKVHRELLSLESKQDEWIINFPIIVKRVIEKNIYGVDIQKDPVNITNFRLILYYLEKLIKYNPKPHDEQSLIHDITTLKNNIKQGNTLVGLTKNTINNEILHVEENVMKEIKEEGKNNLFMLNNHHYIFLKNHKLLKDIFSFEEYLELKPFHWILEYQEIFKRQRNESNLQLEKKGNQGFDIIIGNPPYLNNKKMNKFNKKIYKAHQYYSAYKLYDLSVLFIERAFYLLKNGGIFSYITTNKFISTDYGIKIREFLVKKTFIHEIIDVSHVNVFKNIATYPIILTYSKAISPLVNSKNKNNKRANRNTIVNMEHNPDYLSKIKKNQVRIAPNISKLEHLDEVEDFSQIIKQKVFMETPNFILDISGNAQICDVIRQQNIKFLKNLGCTWIYRPLGFTNWKDSLKYVKERKLQQNNSTKNKPSELNEELSEINALPFIGCGNIKKYWIDWNKTLQLSRQKFQNQWFYRSDLTEEDWMQFSGPQILMKEVATKITAAYNEGYWAHLTGVYSLNCKNAQVEPKYLLLVLNSKLLNFYYNSIFGSSHMAKNYLNFHASYLDNLPILLATLEQQEHCKLMAEYLIFLHQLPATEFPDEEQYIIEESKSIIKEVAELYILKLYFYYIIFSNNENDGINIEKTSQKMENSFNTILHPIDYNRWMEEYKQNIFLPNNLFFERNNDIISKNLQIIETFCNQMQHNHTLHKWQNSILKHDWIKAIYMSPIL